MAIIDNTIAAGSAAYKANRDGMLALIARMRALEERARAASAGEAISRPAFRAQAASASTSWPFEVTLVPSQR